MIGKCREEWGRGHTIGKCFHSYTSVNNLAITWEYLKAIKNEPKDPMEWNGMGVGVPEAMRVNYNTRISTSAHTVG